jgi:hypothetical protein
MGEMKEIFSSSVLTEDGVLDVFYIGEKEAEKIMSNRSAVKSLADEEIEALTDNLGPEDLEYDEKNK